MESFFFWPADYLHNAKVLHLVKERSIVCPSLSTVHLHKSRSKTGRLSKIGALNAKRKKTPAFVTANMYSRYSCSVRRLARYLRDLLSPNLKRSV